MKALITRGAGLLGRERLANLQDPVVLSRDPARASRKRPTPRSSEVLMASQRVLPCVAGRAGYTSKHTELEGALAAVMAAPSRTPA